jgi:glycosyltransferase involved in cell wall biosynthesis
MLTTISNLYPRPDQPTRGLYNYYLFGEMASLTPGHQNICLVPEWRLWRWRSIRQWKADGGPATIYVPVFTLPLLGRSMNWIFYRTALRRYVWGGCPHPPCASKVPPGTQADEDIRPTLMTTSHCSLPSAHCYYVPWLYPDGVAVASAIKGTGARLWLMALGSDTFHLSSGLRRRRILEACTQAEGIICVAKVLADRLADAGVPCGKLHVVPNGVDASLFRVRNKEEVASCSVDKLLSEDSRGISSTTQQLNNSTTVLFVGNLVPVKGVDVLLEAVAMLTTKRTSNIEQGRAKAPDCSPLKVECSPSLILIGDGPERENLERLAGKLGIADQVRFLGRLPPAEVSKWMNRADCLCLPSRSEGMPNVVLEARACGCPVVATPAGACQELPLSRDGLRVARDFTAESLAEELQQVIAHPPGRTPDPVIPSWSKQARKVLELIDP